MLKIKQRKSRRIWSIIPQGSLEVEVMELKFSKENSELEKLQ